MPHGKRSPKRSARDRISRGELAVGRGLYGYFRHEPFERDLHGGRLPGRSDGLRRRTGHSEPCGAFGLRRHLVERTVIVRDLALGLASQVVQCADPGKGTAVGDGIETVRLPRCGVRYGNGRRLSRNLRSGELALQYGVPVAVEYEQREPVPIFFSQLSAAAVWSKKARVSGVLSVRVIFTTLPVAESAISSVCLLQEASMARAAVAAKIIFFIDLIDFMPFRAAVNKKWWMNVSR